RAFQALLLDHALDVSIFPAGDLQEPAVRTGCIAVDGAPRDGQERLLTSLEAAAQHRAGLLQRQGVPKGARQAADKPHATRRVPQTWEITERAHHGGYLTRPITEKAQCPTRDPEGPCTRVGAGFESGTLRAL